MKEDGYRPTQILTKREREVFELLVQDKTTREIAKELFISEKTVRNHISNEMKPICKLEKYVVITKPYFFRTQLMEGVSLCILKY
ncbi:helix-turn-helix domain-containing protein [Halobacillus litoralis]|uniref:helix-turn-helix domain-containing protein n=1 Tax=Halobacillus litoralis TaxID=45668 RepID=UPI001CD7FECB|nr:helix-turn-helix transcriptional regulator [Halobacillus litoralis]MCA1021830.1 helix-turn-helix transcriptional regulator [Halobacillus litoralis]